MNTTHFVMMLFSEVRFKLSCTNYKLSYNFFLFNFFYWNFFVIFHEILLGSFWKQFKTPYYPQFSVYISGTPYSFHPYKNWKISLTIGNLRKITILFVTQVRIPIHKMLLLVSPGSFFGMILRISVLNAKRTCRKHPGFSENLYLVSKGQFLKCHQNQLK